jgi:hypothetical protein
VRRAASRRRRRVRALALCVVGAAFLLAGPLAARSHAGTYVSRDCASSNGGYSAAQYDQSHTMAVITQDCGSGGTGLGMAVPTSGWTPSQTGASWTINTPTGTHFTNVWLLQRGASHLAAGWDLEVFVAGPGGSTPLGAHKDGSAVWAGLASATGNYTIVTSRLTCNAGNGCNGSLQAGLYTRDYIFNMVDDTAPTVGASGELLNGEVQRGTGDIDVFAQDAGTGLNQVYVVVNGRVAGRQDYACPGSASSAMQPCTLSQHMHFNLDTQSAPFHDGANEVEVCAADYATMSAPNIECTATRAVNVDNSCSPSRVPGGTDLSAHFIRSDDDAVTVRSRQSATVTGRLRDRSGNPVAGAALCVRETTLAPGKVGADVGTVKTDQEGRYRYTIAPGPNRDVEIGYRYNRRQLQRDVRYFARVAPSLRLSRERVRNGRRIRLFGSLPGPSNAGRIVVLQARYPGKNQRWKMFQKARTDQTGHFSAPYRFLATFTTTEYRMRAVVPAQSGYPFLAGHSRGRPIKVVGHR